MALIMRNGLIEELDLNKLTSGEWAIVRNSNGKAFYCYAPGKSKEVASVSDLQGILNSSPEAYTALQQLIVALGNETVLTGMLNDISSLNSNLDTKADTTYVNTEIQNKLSQVQGFYATVSALTTAFPSGNTNNYVVTADNYIYRWSGSAWVSTNYLWNANGVADGTITPSKASFLEIINQFNKNDITIGKINHALYGWITDANFQDTGFMPVIPNTEYICNLIYKDNSYINYWTKTKTGISSVSGSSAFTGSKVLTVPNNLNIAYVSLAIGAVENIDTLMFVKGTALPSTYIAHKFTFTNEMANFIQTKDIENKSITVEKLADGVIGNSKINGKVFDKLGDSLSSDDYTLPNWSQIISSRTGASFNDYAISGTSIAVRNGRTDSFIERYTTMNTSADGVLVMGCTNDGATPLGTWDSTDITTFFGALNTLMQGLINMFAGKPIIFITPTPLWFNPSLYSKNPLVDLLNKSSTDTVTIQLRVQAVIEKCRQYGLHCTDIYNKSGINYYDTNHVYYVEDQTHQSAISQLRCANVIEADLETMF